MIDGVQLQTREEEFWRPILHFCRKKLQPSHVILVYTVVLASCAHVLPTKSALEARLLAWYRENKANGFAIAHCLDRRGKIFRGEFLTSHFTTKKMPRHI